jgi:uncharacterized delta-60 repeat protein
MHLAKKLLLTTSFALSIGLASACDSNETPPPVSEVTIPPGETPAATGDFDITLSTVKLPVLQGTAATLQVTVTRKAGFVQPITLSQVGLPAGATMAEVTLSPTDAVATLTIATTAATPHSLPTPVAILARAGTSNQMVQKALMVTVTGAPGALDTSFGGGKVIVPVGASDDYAYAMAAQPDGKILLAGRAYERLGDFAIVRLERDGALDATFGTGGKVTIDFNGKADIAQAIAVAPDGTILVAGSSSGASAPGTDFALARLLPTGALDPAFGTGGKVVTDFGGDSETGYALQLYPDGKILVGGDSNSGGTVTGLDFALARYNPDGSLDAGFGMAGKVLTQLSASGGRDSIYDIALEDMGGELRIVAVGGEGDFSLARYLADGQLDPSFGAGGKLTAVFGSVIGAARGVKVAPDGKIVVAGHAGHDFALARFSVAGQLDAGFGAGGKVVTAMSSSNWDEAQGLAIEADGKVVVAGWTYEMQSSSGNFAVARYDLAGQLDPSFGGTGMVISEIAAKTKPDQATAVLLQVDERVPAVRLLVAGYASSSNSDFAVARYWR